MRFIGDPDVSPVDSINLTSAGGRPRLSQICQGQPRCSNYAGIRTQTGQFDCCVPNQCRLSDFL